MPHANIVLVCATCAQVPFSLSCKTPGRFRWVTTNIARFDPSIDWPTDLDCSFDWNKALKAYDGEHIVR